MDPTKNQKEQQQQISDMNCEHRNGIRNGQTATAKLKARDSKVSSVYLFQLLCQLLYSATTFNLPLSTEKFCRSKKFLFRES